MSTLTPITHVKLKIDLKIWPYMDKLLAQGQTTDWWRQADR